LADVDACLFAATGAPPSRREVLEALVPYAERHLRGGGRLNNVTRHILGLYHGRPRARAFRRYLSERAPAEGVDIHVLREAIRMAEGEGAAALVAAQ
jgi:tRNA-dihydrouridine synthase A